MTVILLLSLIFFCSTGLLCIVIQLLRIQEEDLPLVDPSEELPGLSKFQLFKTTIDVLNQDKKRSKSVRKRGYTWNPDTLR